VVATSSDVPPPSQAVLAANQTLSRAVTSEADDMAVLSLLAPVDG
jgi:hypothetical protein